MGNTSSRQNIYQDYHNSLQHNNVAKVANSVNYENSTKDTIDLKNIDMKKLNHYEV